MKNAEKEYLELHIERTSCLPKNIFPDINWVWLSKRKQ